MPQFVPVHDSFNDRLTTLGLHVRYTSLRLICCQDWQDLKTSKSVVDFVIFNVSQSYCARYIGWTSVCPSVCLTVTRWYCVETAQLPIVKLSSLPGSPMILVSWLLRTKLFPGIPMGTPPTGALNARGRKKLKFLTNLAIARKRLKIDGYMLLCVWPALNPLSIHVTFTAIVRGRGVPREAKMCKSVLKWLTFTGWITGKRLKIDGNMLRCIWQALNPLFIHVTFTVIVRGG